MILSRKLRMRTIAIFMTTVIVLMILGCISGTKAMAAGENLAYGKTVTVSSTESSSYPGSAAVDGNGSTRWASAYSDNQNFVVDLGGTYTVSSVKIAWEAAYASQFQIQTSTDRSVWTTVYSNYSGTGGTQTISFSAVSARYVKMYGIKRATSYGFSIYEFEVYGSGGTATTTAATTTTTRAPSQPSGSGNLAYGKTVTVSSTESSSYPGSAAVDGNGSTRWASAYSDNQNFVVDLGGTYTVSSVKIAWEAAYASQFQIQTSTDRSVWTTVYSNYSGTGGTQTISFSAVSARYVKMYGVKRATSYGFSIYEFEVYGSGGAPATTTTRATTTTTAPSQPGGSGNLAYGKTVTVSSTESSSYPGSAAVDANGNTRWSSSYADNQNFVVDLGGTYTVSSVKIAWEAAYASQFQIQTSTDRSVWTTVYSNYSATGGTQNISFSGTSARYVKVYCIKRATSYGFSMYEFEVYGSGGSGSGNPLSGKTLFFLGSSVTYGYASGGVSFVDYIASRNGCTSVKEAVSGTTLVDNGSSSYVRRMLNNLNANAHCDYFVCQLSTNDASQGLPLGQVSSSQNLNDFNTSTIVGAMEYIICYARNTWNCPVAFYTGTYYDNANYQAMVNALYSLQSKWGIGIIDLWNNQAMRNVSSADYARYMSDSVHPTAAGYLEWWTPVIESYLKSALA